MSGNIELERAALDLLMAALEQEPDSRLDYVRGRCAGNDALLARVTKLLTWDHAGDEPLDSLELPTSLPARSPPVKLGPYRLLNLIGQGGMGSVYRAERMDGAFERTVAIKLLGASALTKGARERFDVERHLMAQLRHPNITTLLDGGVDGDISYLVMEYIDGSPFTHDPGVSRNRQLRRFIKVCAAVGHAHSRLILHRDIKPSNVMIDSAGEPKLLDFGIAKLLHELNEHSTGSAIDLTVDGGLPMTPSYTAPECLEGEPSTVRSDVYSLGVLLFEVLAGRRPFEVAGLSPIKAAQVVRSSTPASLDSGHADLDQIVATAMHLDPERRYYSAIAMAEDITRLLERRPIVARKDDLLYVLWRFFARNRVLVGIVAFAGAAVVTALIAALIALQEANDQRALAERQTATSQSALKFLSDVLQADNPMSAAATDSIRDALASVANSINNPMYEMEVTPETRLFILSNLANIHAGRAERDLASTYIAQSQALLEADKDFENEELIWQQLAATLFNLGEFDQSLAAVDKAFVTPLGFDQPLWRYRIGGLNSRASALALLGRGDEAVEQFNAVIRLNQDYPLFPLDLASAHHGVSNVYANRDEREKAIQHNADALSIAEQFGFLNSSLGLTIQANRVDYLDWAGRHSEADTAFQMTLSGLERTFGREHPAVVELVANRGRALHARGEAAQAVQVMLPWRDYVRERMSLKDPRVSYFEAKLGYALCASNGMQPGIEALQHALISARAVYPPDNWNIPDIEGAIGYCHMLLGDYSQAEEMIRRSHDKFLDIFGPDHYATKGKVKWLKQIEERRSGSVQ